jgi:hypothetical protein
MSQEVVRQMLSRLGDGGPGGERGCLCESALAMALITERSAIPAETLRKLAPIVGKYIPV